MNPTAAKALDKQPDVARAQIIDALHANAVHGTGDTKAMAGALG